MNENSNIVALLQPDEIDDPLDEYLAIWALGSCLRRLSRWKPRRFRRDEGLEASRRPRPPRAAWPWPSADDPDGIGAVEVARSRFGTRGWPALASGFASLGDPAAVARRTKSLDALLPVL